MNDLISIIDFTKIEATLINLKLEFPSFLKEKFTLDEIELTIGTVQLTYINNEYSITKIYLTRNDKIEIVLDSNYAFCSFNYFTDENCFAFNDKGSLLYSYVMTKKDILLEKSNGDLYQLPESLIEDKELNNIRLKWKNSLLCYSHKLDGRNCFYILIKCSKVFIFNPF